MGSWVPTGRRALVTLWFGDASVHGRRGSLSGAKLMSVLMVSLAGSSGTLCITPLPTSLEVALVGDIEGIDHSCDGGAVAGCPGADDLSEGQGGNSGLLRDKSVVGLKNETQK